MNKKHIFLSLFSVIFFSLVFSYSLVFSSGSLFDNKTKINFSLTDVIYLDSLSLSKTKILFKSGEDLNGAKLESKCDIFSKLSYTKGDYYYFDLRFFGNKCSNEDISLVNSKGEVIYNFSIKLLSEYDILSRLLDQKTERLLVAEGYLEDKISKYSKYEEYNPDIEKNYFLFLKNNRILDEAIYNYNLVKNIIKKRSEKYIVPILGRGISTKKSKIPNAGRPYRASYTNGVHRGWDVDTELGGEQVVALDDGIIIRTVSKFKYSELNNIKYGDNLSVLEKARNLDILRGNQVWLKTMKGDVVLYSHLTDIFTNIAVGEVVRKGQPLGTDGITGVPDKNYSDFHLHFTILKNPFKKNIVEYELDDYMLWDWEFKGKSKEYILKNQSNIFEI